MPLPNLAEDLSRRMLHGSVYLMVAIWGFGPIDKTRMLYPIYGINLGDLMFLGLVVAWLGAQTSHGRLTPSLPEPPLRLFLGLQLAFGGWALLSTLVNGVLDGGPVLDLFGAMRLFFCAAMVLFIVRWSARHGVAGVATAFCVGTLLSGAFNLYRQYQDPVSMLVAGLPQLEARNQSGAMFATVIVFAVFLLIEHRPLRALGFAGGALFLSAFTFSKGAWLMALLALGGFLVVLRARTLKARGAYAVKLLVLLILIAGAAGVYQQREVIGNLVQAKIASVQGDAREGVVDVGRLGHILSSLDIAAENPLFGCGEARWEAENAANREWLGSWYLGNDNPHNGLMAILSMMGFPAFFLFMALFAVPFLVLDRILPLPRLGRLAVVLSMAGMMFLSANVMLQVYTQYYFWVFSGLALGFAAHRRTTSVAAPRPISAPLGPVA